MVTRSVHPLCNQPCVSRSSAQIGVHNPLQLLLLPVPWPKVIKQIIPDRMIHMLKDNEKTHQQQEQLREETRAAKESVPEAPESGEVVQDIFTLDDIFRRILASADSELDKKTQLLFWSGLAAGLTLGLTFLARAVFTALAPEARPGLIGSLFYPIGFAIIVIGRYQLFTENTLTPVTLVLTRLASVRDLLRLWGIVYLANLLGAFVIAVFLATTGVLDAEVADVALNLGRHILEESWADLFTKAIVAGWLVASMVWLVHAAKDTVTRLLVVWLVMYLVGVAGLYHCITNSAELFYLAFRGEASLLSVFPAAIIPATLGNIVGGVIFVALVNYMQFEQEPFVEYGTRLSWRAWLWGKR